MTNEADEQVRPVEEVWGDFHVHRTVMGLCNGTIGLQDVEWSKMHHGYGDAATLPTLLDRITGSDMVLAAEAMDTMWGMGFVEGVTTVPGALATPFLLRAATDPAVGQRYEPLLAAAQHSQELGLIEPALDRTQALWSDRNKPSAVRVAGAIAWLCLTSGPPPAMLTQTVTLLTTPAILEALYQVPWIDHLEFDQLPVWLAALLHDPASGSSPPQLWPQPGWDPWETPECQK